jgi:hypothetical protein
VFFYINESRHKASGLKALWKAELRAPAAQLECCGIEDPLFSILALAGQTVFIRQSVS